MRHRVPFAFLIVFSIAGSATAQVCVKCIARNCVGGLPSGYVNCGSNGNLCIQWTQCTGGESPVAALQAPYLTLGQDTPAWRLVSVETHSSRQSTPQWRLANAATHAANERSVIRRSAIHR